MNRIENKMYQTFFKTIGIAAISVNAAVYYNIPLEKIAPWIGIGISAGGAFYFCAEMIYSNNNVENFTVTI